MGGGHNQILHEVVFLGGQTGNALAAPLLRTISIHRNSLHIAQMSQGDADVFFLDQILFIDFLCICLDLGTALVAPFILDFQQLGFDHAHQFMNVRQQLIIVCDFFQQFLIFVFDFLFFQTLQTSQLHIQNGLGLDLGK